MSEESDTSSVILWFLVGLLFGGTIVLVVIITSTNGMYPIERIQKGQQDCLIKEYYYLDEHRDFCDKLGVKP